MTIGIFILCAAILLIFFGFAEKFFRRLGIANWLAFLLVLALVVGAVVPNISIGERFVINVSGFLIPIAIMIIFEAFMGFGSELLRSIMSQIAVAAVAITVRLLMPDDTSVMIVTTSLLIGFLCGAVAYLVAQTRMSIIASVMGGIVLGDIIVGLIGRYVYNYATISLGTGGVFNSIILAVVFGLVILEVINAMIRVNSRKRINSGTLSFEAAEDANYEFESQKMSKSRKLSNRTTKEEKKQEIEEFGEYEDYFDDRLL